MTWFVSTQTSSSLFHLMVEGNGPLKYRFHRDLALAKLTLNPSAHLTFCSSRNFSPNVTFCSTITPHRVLPSPLALGEPVHLTAMHFVLILFIALSHKAIYYVNLLLLLRKTFNFEARLHSTPFTDGPACSGS